MKKALEYILLGLVGLIVLLLVWGVGIEPRLINTEEEIAAIPNLPAAWEGKQVAVLADFQIGMWGANTGTIRRIVDRLVERPPAAVLIAGDFVYKADDQLDEVIPTVTELVRPLVRAGVPVFAVLGNHDYSIDVREDPKNERVARAVRTALERAGVQLLHNEAVPLPSPNSGTASREAAPLYIVGIGPAWAHEDAPVAAVSRVPRDAARIVFMHNPHSFGALPAGTAPLAIAAHTHGGQIALPFTPRWSWMSLVKEVEVYADGWIKRPYGQPGNRLYVNIGIGFSDVPIRINSRPELTVFTLRGAAEPSGAGAE